MDYSNKSDDELKEYIISILIEVAKVDNNVDGRELMYLLDVGKIYGYSPEEVRSFLYNAKTQPKIPQAEKDRMTILYMMLFLMKIDGKVSQQEVNIVFHYGFKLGFNESLLRELISAIKNHINKQLPPDELINKVKKYLN